jgi:hypothetical protein
MDSWRVRGAGVRAGVLVLLLLGLLGNARCFNVVLTRGYRTTDFLITVSAPDTGGNRAAFSAAFSLRSKTVFLSRTENYAHIVSYTAKRTKGPGDEQGTCISCRFR